MANISFQTIESLWNELSKTPLPENWESFAAADYNDLAIIDTFAAGCISTFIGTRGRLDRQHYECLKTCIESLSIGIETLDAGPLKTYAEQLHFLSKSVLDYAE